MLVVRSTSQRRTLPGMQNLNTGRRKRLIDRLGTRRPAADDSSLSERPVWWWLLLMPGKVILCIFLQSRDVLDLKTRQQNFLKGLMIDRANKELALNDNDLSLFLVDDNSIYFLVVWLVRNVVASLYTCTSVAVAQVPREKTLTIIWIVLFVVLIIVRSARMRSISADMTSPFLAHKTGL
jgi:hypothetical protein